MNFFLQLFKILALVATFRPYPSNHPSSVGNNNTNSNNSNISANDIPAGLGVEQQTPQEANAAAPGGPSATQRPESV